MANTARNNRATSATSHAIEKVGIEMGQLPISLGALLPSGVVVLGLASDFTPEQQASTMRKEHGLRYTVATIAYLVENHPIGNKDKAREFDKPMTEFAIVREWITISGRDGARISDRDYNG